MFLERTKYLDLILLVLWTAVAYVITYNLGGTYLFSALFFFVLPTVYIFMRKPTLVRKTLFVSFAVVVPLTFVFDYLAHKDGSWVNYSAVHTFVLGIVPIDDFVWGILYFVFFIAFYEYFFDAPNKNLGQKIPKRFYTTAKTMCVLTVASVFFFALFPDFKIPFFYSWAVALIFVLIPAVFLYMYHHFLKAVGLTALFFSFLSLMYEHVANVHNQWAFPGSNFIAHVHYWGNLIPLEEFIWLFVAVPAFLVYYEIFSDDRK